MPAWSLAWRVVPGLALAGIAAAAGTLVAVQDPAAGRAVAVQALAGFFIGRETGIPLGLAGGLGWPAAALVQTLVEWSILLVAFPLLVLAGSWLHRLAPVERLVARAARHAQAHPDADALALAGLAVFPFLPAGALTMALVGSLLALPPRRLLAFLLAAELAANAATAYAAAALVSRLPDPRLAALLLAMLTLGAAVAVGAWHARHERQGAGAPR